MARASDAEKYIDEEGRTRYRRPPGRPIRQTSKSRSLTDEQIEGTAPVDDSQLEQALGGMKLDNLLKNKSQGYKKRHGFGRPRSLDVLLRRAKALELRRAGFTWQEIANRKSLGYSSARNAERDVHRLLQQMIDTPAKEVLALELSRLDAVTQVLWQQVRGGDLGAINALFQSMKMRADLLGLNQINIRHEHVTVNDLDQEIERLTKELEQFDKDERDSEGTSISDKEELEAARRAAGL
jgi:hypothetical protein